eukprot:TRINITY_DN9359_c0_g1_i2.p1 TRINITY_DN9359_c0_g1~~TRINITY_DN9359_c0_g1_i2.p1  ORF type:complete len:465 (+),score=81.45 TRINITY_DN9359_c0_g1_i2:134-1528(+)
MERQALLSTVHVAPVGQDVDGFEAYVINVRAAFHRLRLRWNRNLAFLCLFDVLFSFITWALVSQGFHGDFKQNYIAHSVVDFHFSQSLFDVICVSAFRALLLAVAYYMLRSRSSVYMTFAVTASTCFLLVKIFYYGFTDSSQHPSDYMVIFVAFIMPWLECYIWLSRIAPLNRKISLLYGETTGGVVQPSDIEQMLIEERQMTNQFQVPTQLRYGATGLTPQTRPVDALAVGTSAKPINPPQYDAYTTHRVDINEGLGDSDVEDATLAQHRQRSRDNSSDHSPFSTPPSEPSEYIETRSQASSSQITVPMRAMGQMAPNDVFFATLAQSALNFVSEHARLEDSLWRVKEADKNGVVVHSIVKAEGPVYRSQGLIFSSPEQVFRVLYDQFERVPDWSRTFTACKVLRRIEKHTDMIYWATSDAVKQVCNMSYSRSRKLTTFVLRTTLCYPCMYQSCASMLCCLQG